MQAVAPQDGHVVGGGQTKRTRVRKLPGRVCRGCEGHSQARTPLHRHGVRAAGCNRAVIDGCPVVAQTSIQAHLVAQGIVVCHEQVEQPCGVVVCVGVNITEGTVGGVKVPAVLLLVVASIPTAPHQGVSCPGIGHKSLVQTPPASTDPALQVLGFGLGAFVLEHATVFIAGRVNLGR